MRTFRLYALVVILSLLPLVSFFSTSLLPHTHDGLVHLARIGAYFKALTDGQIPVRWAGDLNYGYGMPLFNFIYQLPYFIASIFIFLGFGLVSSFKITLALSFILSGIFMFGFSSLFFKDVRKAFLVTIFYQFAPFRLVEILVRGSFGEVYTYTFLPLALWGITLLFNKPNFWYVLLTSIGAASLVISHNAISLVFFVIALGFVICFGRGNRRILGFASLILGLLLSSFYWIPAIFEHKYTYGDLFMKSVYLSNFPPFQNFFLPNFLNDMKLNTQGVSVQIGLFHTLAFFIALFTFFRYRELPFFTKKLIAFFFLIAVCAFFFMQPISTFIWANLSLLRQFQFPWRLLSVIVVSTSILSVCLLHYKFFNKKLVYYGVLFLVIVSTLYYWKPALLDKIEEKDYWNFPLNTTYYGETDIIWSEGPAKSYPRERVEVIGGKATVGKIDKKSNKHTFTVDAKTNTQLVSHTQYFPGWRVYVDNVSTPIQFQDPNHRGEIVFLAPEGKHNVELIFGESKIRFVGDFITISALIFLVIFGVFRKRVELV